MKHAIGATALVLAVAFAVAAHGQDVKNVRVKRGEYLARVAGCHDCHTPMKVDPKSGMPMPDHERLLAGHPVGAPDPAGTLAKGDFAVFSNSFTAILTPFGTIYAANLTPHKTGLGDWTEEMFVRAMRTGRHLGDPSGRPIFPPMPWPNVGSMTDEDLSALFAYFQSLPPVDNAVPAPKTTEAQQQKVLKLNEAMRPKR